MNCRMVHSTEQRVRQLLSDKSYSLADLSNGGGTTTISKTVGRRFGGLELHDVENAGGDFYFDDTATICPNKDEFDYAFAYYCQNKIDHADAAENDDDVTDDGRCTEESIPITGRDRRVSKHSSLSNVTADCEPTHNRCDNGELLDAFKKGGRTSWSQTSQVNGLHSQISTNDTSRPSAGLRTHVYRYCHGSSNKTIIILVVLTSVVALVCVTVIMIDDYKNNERNGNASSGKWSKNHAVGDYEDSRLMSISPSFGPTLLATPAPLRNIFESKPYSRGSDSPSPTSSKLQQTINPSPISLDLAKEFHALDIPRLPTQNPVSTPWSQHPSRIPTTIPAPNTVSKQPTLSPSLQPRPQLPPTDNPSTRPSPSPFSIPTFHPSPSHIPSTREPTGPPTVFPSQPHTTGVPTLALTFVSLIPTTLVVIPMPLVNSDFGECPSIYSPTESYRIGSFVSTNHGGQMSSVFKCDGAKCSSGDHIPPDPSNFTVSGWIMVGICTISNPPTHHSLLAPTISPSYGNSFV